MFLLISRIAGNLNATGKMLIKTKIYLALPIFSGRQIKFFRPFIEMITRKTGNTDLNFAIPKNETD